MSKWATVVRYGGVGDNLIASSVLKGLKAKFGNVEVLTQEPQHVVFENNPFIDKLVVMKKDQIPKEAWAEWHYLRSKETDGFFHLSHSCETLTAYLPGQVQFTWPADARRKFAGRSYLEVVHDICGLDYDCISPNFYPTEEEHADAERVKKNKIGGRYIAWVLTGTRLDKIYPWTSDAIARLICELDIPVVMIGGPGKDHELATLLQTQVGRHNGSTRGLHSAISYNPDNPNWPLRRILTLVQHADLVIGPDTGPMWAVAMHDMHKIMLLSHASPENITKHWRNTTTLHADQSRVSCHPCHLLHDVIGTCRPHKNHSAAACISDISVDQIMTAAEAALRRGAKQPAEKADSQAEAPAEPSFLPLNDAPLAIRGNGLAG